MDKILWYNYLETMFSGGRYYHKPEHKKDAGNSFIFMIALSYSASFEFCKARYIIEILIEAMKTFIWKICMWIFIYFLHIISESLQVFVILSIDTPLGAWALDKMLIFCPIFLNPKIWIYMQVLNVK